MERRELLKLIAAATGATVIGGELLLSGCNTSSTAESSFSPEDIALLDEVGETIIPATTTPGAKAAEIGKFMQTIVTDCGTEKEQHAFKAGIPQLKDACKKLNGKDFMTCSADERKAFLVSLEKEAKDFNTKRDADDKAAADKANAAGEKFEGSPSHYYTFIKQLTLFGYFTSKPGASMQLRNNPVPGRYDGAYPYKVGEHAFSE